MIRPPIVWGFAAGLSVGSLAIAAVAYFGAAADESLPECATPVYVSWSP